MVSEVLKKTGKLSDEEYRYTVTAISEISGDDVQALENDSSPITLLTCNFDGENRILIRCS